VSNFNQILGCERNAQSRKPGDVHAPSRHYSRAITFITDAIFFESCFLIVSIAFYGFKSVLSPFVVSSRMNSFLIHKFSRLLLSFTMDTPFVLFMNKSPLVPSSILGCATCAFAGHFTKRILSREYFPCDSSVGRAVDCK
jgi:hypothetical protein